MSYSSSGSDSVCASPLLSHSSVSNSKQQSPGGPRVLKRLPKRIRLDPHVHVAQQELKQEQQHAATAEPKQLSSSSSSSKARVSLAHKLQQQSDVDGSLPALDSSDATSAENEDALPCTPPTEQSHHHQQQSFYQPLFAPVDHIVKQAALSTSLFAPAVSASSCDAASSSSNSSGLSHEQLAPHQPGDVHVVKEEDEVFPEADEDQLHFWDTSAADQTVRHQPAPHSRSNSSNNNNKKRKVPQQLVPTDRSLVSDHGDSEDDVASDEHLHYHDHTYAHANEHAQQQQQGDYGHGSPLPPSASCQGNCASSATVTVPFRVVVIDSRCAFLSLCFTMIRCRRCSRRLSQDKVVPPPLHVCESFTKASFAQEIPSSLSFGSCDLFACALQS